ncbi:MULTISPECIES: hypothetical protein [Bifidobacterium]|jgi:hypothetical protein|uniref:Uncharacterized protein n=1 Tax=Bifidobacterium tibiigranuli TaxID=2172043 RepID=A0A5N6S314_9BIFI|nr:hypothetical protein [Bifidobacterium tibiigranuli]KAE8128049.1 hypothetical protein DDE84_06560 [Bifidobacterium tibiigranuli]KAE8128209.1 hypothetical protein DDF78_06350 [Bifidobacterium tibiigranuli]MCH3974060.1 hypothetical protein [Bifidobacterium tibiigranuli]MCH4189090.1 hypothetical protein [Bifidobacterium tibiigranuli]MCH4204050.1 hypothetical protein [Bifidobacterium tibiigranuli]
MTVLTFDDVKYAKAEAEARRRGVDLRAKLSREVDAYAYDADVRESDSAEGDEIVGVWHTPDDVHRYFAEKLRKAGRDV